MGYNKIILEGHLTRDIELKYTAGGAAIGNTAIATSRKYKTAAGEQKEEVLFVDLAFFGKTAEIANQYLRKGSHILVDGRLKLDQWTDQTTQAKRSKHSVTVESMQMLGNKDDATNAGQPAGAPQQAYGQPAAQPAYGQPAAQPAPQHPAQPRDAQYAQPQQPAPQPGYAQPAPAPQPQYQPPAQPQQPTYNHPGQPGYGQQQAAQQPGQVATAPNGAPITMDEQDIPF